MTSRGKKWVIALAALVVGLTAVLCIERVRGEWALRQMLKSLRAVGEKLEPEELLPARTNPPPNGLWTLQSVNDSGVVKEVIRLAPPRCKLDQRGYATASWQFAEWPLEKKSNANWSMLAGAVNSTTGAVALIRQAVEQPSFTVEAQYTAGFLAEDFGHNMDRLTSLRGAMQLLNGHIALALFERKAEAVHGLLASQIELAGRLADERFLITQLVRIACIHNTLDNTWESLQRGILSPAQLQDLQQCWERLTLVADYGRCFEMERAMTKRTFDRVRQSRPELCRALRDRNWEDTRGPGEVWIQENLYGPVWRFAWLAQDEQRALQRWGSFLEAYRTATKQGLTGAEANLRVLPLSGNDLPFLLDDDNKTGWYDRLRYLYSAQSAALTTRLIRRPFFIDAQIRMAVLALALERFRIDRTRFPEQLGELTPHFLSQVPADPVSGQSFIYRRDGSGFQLYSPGEDGKDDGADATPDRSPRYWPYTLGEGRDAVWPRLATNALQNPIHPQSP